METVVKIGEKEYKIREITYLEALEIEETRQKSTTDAVKKLLTLSVGMTDEEAIKLSLRDGTKLQTAINDVNNLDFQKTAQEEEQS